MRWGLLGTILGLLVIGALVGGAFIKFEGHPPEMGFDPAAPTILGRENSFRFIAIDQGQGLKNVRLTLTQGEKTKVLGDHHFPGQYWVLGSQRERAEFDISIPIKRLGFKDGPAVFRAEVRDHAWRDSFHGNGAIFEQRLEIDTKPPVIGLAGPAANHANLGGTGLAIFTTNEEARSGVAVGDSFFPALPLGDPAKKLFSALFAVPHDLKPGTRIVIKAVDKAGNTTQIGFPVQIKKRRFRVSKMNISRKFASAKMPEFRQNYPDLPQDDIEAYIKVNHDIRLENNATIRKAASGITPERLWRGRFLQLKNSARTARYADARTYYHQGRIIDRQSHMGQDLASVARANVPAANHGRVVLAGYIGIYGQTVIIDHGQGLHSLYAHLSKIDVAKDQEVKKGQIIGQTGTTGMAGGDHLHYSILVAGHWVDPLEWYDPRWIKHNITGKEEIALSGK